MRDKNQLFRNGFLTHLMNLGVIKDNSPKPSGKGGIIKTGDTEKEADEGMDGKWGRLGAEGSGCAGKARCRSFRPDHRTREYRLATGDVTQKISGGRYRRRGDARTDYIIQWPSIAMRGGVQ